MQSIAKNVIGAGPFFCRIVVQQQSALLSNNLHERAFASSAVELTIKNLFPGAKIKCAVRDRDHHLAPHYLALHMRVRIVLSRTVMLILRGGSMRREPFKPNLVIVQQSVFRIIDENGSSDVHRVDQAKAFLHTALADQLLYTVSDINESPAIGDFEPKMFRQAFHAGASSTTIVNSKPLKMRVYPRAARLVKLVSNFRGETECTFRNSFERWLEFAKFSIVAISFSLWPSANSLRTA